VSATNIYGAGEKSDLSEAIIFGAVPSKLTNLKSDNVDQNLKTKATITWDAPSADDAVTGYKFEVLNLDTNAYVDAESIFQDNGTDSARELTCQDLVDTFGYQKGDTIEFRVAVTNEFGDSEWAYPTEANKLAESLSMLIL